jgi:hypothetical protein
VIDHAHIHDPDRRNSHLRWPLTLPYSEEPRATGGKSAVRAGEEKKPLFTKKGKAEEKPAGKEAAEPYEPREKMFD